jgi:hypothetical protein
MKKPRAGEGADTGEERELMETCGVNSGVDPTPTEAHLTM